MVFLTFILSIASSPQTRVKVIHVYDGDTILVDRGIRVRYLGMDAPEMGRDGEEDEYMAKESKAFNAHLVRGERILLETDESKQDRHGRLLAYIFLANGEMANNILVKKGLARISIDPPNLKHTEALLASQRSAMTAKIGIWRQESGKTEKYYTGSSRSYRFHRPGCPSAQQIFHHHLVRFNTRRDAFWEGFSPCRQCRP